MPSSLDPRYITKGPNAGKWTISFPATAGPTKYNKGGSFWFASETAANQALEKYKSGTPKALRAKLNKFLGNRTKITSGQLISAVQRLWGINRVNASSVAHDIKNDFPEVLKNAKGKSIQVSITGGITEAFTDFLNKKLEDQKTIKSDVGDIIKESKVKIKEPTARKIIKRDFKNKVILQWGEKDVSKAIEAYKKLPEQTKINFQTGGPGQQGKYRKWLARQGLTQEFAPTLFYKKIKRSRGL